MEKKSDIMTDNEIVKALNGAGLFLREMTEEATNADIDGVV